MEDAGQGKTYLLEELIPPAAVNHRSGKVAVLCYSDGRDVSSYLITFRCDDSFLSGPPVSDSFTLFGCSHYNNINFYI